MAQDSTGQDPKTTNNGQIAIVAEAFDPWKELTRYEKSHLTAGHYGAAATFVGTMRDFNEGDNISAMELEHYPGMTDSQLQTIVDEARAKWSLDNALIIHRVGRILPGEPIVLVACWSAHRAAAFDACRHLMEELKSRAPFWKKETLKDQSHRWVEKNTDGYTVT